MNFTKAEYAHLFGRYCGHRWIVDATENEKQCFRRHKESVTSFPQLCERVNPYIETEKGVEDNYAAKNKLYLTYARPLGIEKEDLDALPEFWQGFHAGAAAVLASSD